MAKLKVSILNFHGPCSHLEVLIQDLHSTPPKSYIINQWDLALNHAYLNDHDFYLNEASSVFSFEIDGDFNKIIADWCAYQEKTLPTASIVHNNCADAVQWFLTKHAHIPKPSPFAMPLSINHLAFGIFLPSFMPVGITLPGRVMDNAKYHVEVQTGDKETNSQSLFSMLAIATCACTLATCTVGIIGASLFLTGGLSGLFIAGCCVAGGLSMHGMFKPINHLIAQQQNQKPGPADDKFVLAHQPT